jgi:hypothetical protein
LNQPYQAVFLVTTGFRPVLNTRNGTGLMVDICGDVSVFPALSEQLSFAAIVVFGVRRSSPLFREVQAHAEWSGELIRIVPLAGSGERTVER